MANTDGGNLRDPNAKGEDVIEGVADAAFAGMPDSGRLQGEGDTRKVTSSATTTERTTRGDGSSTTTTERRTTSTAEARRPAKAD